MTAIVSSICLFRHRGPRLIGNLLWKAAESTVSDGGSVRWRTVRRDDEILRTASSFFAQAELGRRPN